MEFFWHFPQHRIWLPPIWSSYSWYDLCWREKHDCEDNRERPLKAKKSSCTKKKKKEKLKSSWESRSSFYCFFFIFYCRLSHMVYTFSNLSVKEKNIWLFKYYLLLSVKRKFRELYLIRIFYWVRNKLIRTGRLQVPKWYEAQRNVISG